MYFAYGWPRVFGLDHEDGVTTIASDTSLDIVQLLSDNSYIIAITFGGIQIWSGGRHRVLLGKHIRSAGDLRTEGVYLRAYWSASRRLLAIVTTANVLQFFALRASKKDSVPHATLHSTTTVQELKFMEVFLERSILIKGAAMASDIVGDSRAIMVGMKDGSLKQFSWHAELLSNIEPFSMLAVDGTGSQALHGSLSSFRSTSGSIPLTPRNSYYASTLASDVQQYGSPEPSGLQGSTQMTPSAAAGPPDQTPFATDRRSSFGTASLAAEGAVNGVVDCGTRSSDGGGGFGSGIVAMDYVSAARLLAVVLQGGRVAICHVAESGLSSPDPVQLSHFLCRAGSGAVMVRIGAAVQLVAVGLASGNINLHRLHGSATKGRRSSELLEPVRVLSMHDWGYGPEMLGPVSAMQWAGDDRALAVGWASSGVAVWSPSGCRLMCSLRQASSATMATPRTAPGTYPSPFAAQSAPSQHVLPLEGGIRALTWASCGYSLVLAEDASNQPLLSDRQLSDSHASLDKGSDTAAIDSQERANRNESARQETGATSLEPSQLVWNSPTETATHRSRHLLDIAFARSPTGAHRVMHSSPPWGAAASATGSCREAHLLQAADRVLLVSKRPAGGGASDLTIQHLRPPAVYLNASWPLQHAALSADGADVVVAGARGLATYNRQAVRWRLFGDVSQERAICVKGLVWIPRIIVTCIQAAAEANKGQSALAQLRLYPRSHLDESSCLGRYRLPTVPVAIDAVSYHVVVILPPLDIRLLQVTLVEGAAAGGRASARISVVRQLSMMSVGVPLKDVAIVQPQSMGRRGGDPTHCVLLRAGGAMTVLDLDQGSEVTLADDVECFWLSDADRGPARRTLRGSLDGLDVESSTRSTLGNRTDSMASLMSVASVAGQPRDEAQQQQQQRGNTREDRAQLARDLQAGLSDAMSPSKSTGIGAALEAEMPWWIYSWRGMSHCFPSALTESLSASGRSIMDLSMPPDPELEFDREVYPIGISLSEVAIVGITQRMVLSPQQDASASAEEGFGHGAYPCFHAMPESQPVLPCLLRRLLQKGKGESAVALAEQHCGVPHFSRSLEWLLFTALEANADSQAALERHDRLDITSSMAAVRGKGALARSPVSDSMTDTGQNAPASQLAGPQLMATTGLIRHFDQFPDVVVSVARKMDAALWPALFSAAGPPGDLVQGLLRTERPVSAACCLVIVDKLQGARLAQDLSLQTMQVALEHQNFELVMELLRFLVPPERMEAFQAHTQRPRRHREQAQAAARPGQPRSNANAERDGKAGSAAVSQKTGWLAMLFGGGSSQPRQSSAGEGSSSAEGFETGLQAWRLIAAASRRLLAEGRLHVLASLASSLAAVGLALEDLLCEDARPQPVENPPPLPPPPPSVSFALQAAAAEFPDLLEGRSIETSEATLTARQLLNSCSVAGVQPWAGVLAVLLSDGPCLTDIQQHQPLLWNELAAACSARDTWHERWQSAQQHLSTFGT